MWKRNSPTLRKKRKRLAKNPRTPGIPLTTSRIDGRPHSVTNASKVLQSVCRTEMFNKAYNHISERIDQVYKDLTKGKAAPMGGVAYLSLEDNEARSNDFSTTSSF